MRVGAVVLALVLLAPCVAHAQDQSVLAEQVYVQALQSYEAHQTLTALDRFRASLALHESPNSRLGVARCLTDLGRLGEAVGEYQRTLHEAEDLAASTGRYQRTRDAARDELAALQPRVGWLRVTTAVDALDTFELDGRTLSRAALGIAIPVTPGDVVIVARARGLERTRRTEHVEAGAHVDAVLVASEAARTNELEIHTPIATRPGAVHASRGPMPGFVGLAVTGFAVGAGALVAAGVFDLVTEGQVRALRMDCGAPPSMGLWTCGSDQQGTIAAGQTFETATNVALVVGAVGLVAGATGLVLAWTVRPHATSERAWQIGPSSVRVRF